MCICDDFSPSQMSDDKCRKTLWLLSFRHQPVLLIDRVGTFLLDKLNLEKKNLTLDKRKLEFHGYGVVLHNHFLQSMSTQKFTLKRSHPTEHSH